VTHRSLTDYVGRWLSSRVYHCVSLEVIVIVRTKLIYIMLDNVTTSVAQQTCTEAA